MGGAIVGGSVGGMVGTGKVGATVGGSGVGRGVLMKVGKALGNTVAVATLQSHSMPW